MIIFLLRTQCILHITQDFDAVVDNKPRVCPRYPKATHDPQIIPPLTVSQSISAFFTAPTAPGNKARAATLNLARAYRDESTPGSAITSLATAKFEAHKAHKIRMTPRQARGSTHSAVLP